MINEDLEHEDLEDIFQLSTNVEFSINEDLEFNGLEDIEIKIVKKVKKKTNIENVSIRKSNRGLF